MQKCLCTQNATINYSAVSINNHLKKHARCTEILMHGASSSINKNAVSHEAHWFISVYDLLPKLVKNIHLVKATTSGIHKQNS
jgi:hypothetical protein